MAIDRFKASLLCPACGKSGIAEMHELDGIAYLKGDKATRLDHMPDGFKKVEQRNSMASFDIHCADCGLSAIT